MQSEKTLEPTCSPEVMIPKSIDEIFELANKNKVKNKTKKKLTSELDTASSYKSSANSFMSSQFVSDIIKQQYLQDEKENKNILFSLKTREEDLLNMTEH